MNKRFLNQEEIDEILSALSFKENEDKRFLDIVKNFNTLKHQRFIKFHNFSSPVKEYIPYVIAIKNPSIAVEFNKFIEKILVLESKIGKFEDKLRYKCRDEKVDNNYEVLLKKFENYVKEYKRLVLKYKSLDKLKSELLKNQNQKQR